MLRGHCDRLRNFFSLVFVIHFFVLCSTLLGVNCGQFWYFGTLSGVNSGKFWYFGTPSGVNADNFGIMALFQALIVE